MGVLLVGNRVRLAVRAPSRAVRDRPDLPVGVVGHESRWSLVMVRSCGIMHGSSLFFI